MRLAATTRIPGIEVTLDLTQYEIAGVTREQGASGILIEFQRGDLPIEGGRLYFEPTDPSAREILRRIDTRGTVDHAALDRSIRAGLLGQPILDELFTEIRKPELNTLNMPKVQNTFIMDPLG